MTEQTTFCRPDECLAEDWLAFLGHRWNALVLMHLSDGPKRFSELQTLLPRISPKVLAERLAGMTGRDLVTRDERNGFPREVVYTLTPGAQKLVPILTNLYDWAEGMQADANAGAGDGYPDQLAS